MARLLLLLLLLLPAVVASCPDKDLPRLPASPPHLCVAEASRLLASGLVIRADGSCRLLGVCASSGDAWPCPVYRPLGADRRLLLLRTHVNGGVSPYDLLVNGSLFSADQRSEQEVGGTAWFKSALLRSSGLSLSRIEVQLLLENGTVVVRLQFRVEAGDGAVSAGRWFAKDRLLAASPWAVEKMKAMTFRYFSAAGVAEYYATPLIRRFYISTVHSNCGVDAGFLAVIDAAVTAHVATQARLVSCLSEGERRRLDGLLKTYLKGLERD